MLLCGVLMIVWCFCGFVVWGYIGDFIGMLWCVFCVVLIVCYYGLNDCGVFRFMCLFMFGVVSGIVCLVVSVLICLNGLFYWCSVRLKVLLWIGSS